MWLNITTADEQTKHLPHEVLQFCRACVNGRNDTDRAGAAAPSRPQVWSKPLVPWDAWMVRPEYQVARLLDIGDTLGDGWANVCHDSCVSHGGRCLYGFCSCTE